MKRLIPFLLLVTFALTGCTVRLSDDAYHITTHANAVTDAATKSYIVMGDSIAAHYGVSEKESYDHKLGVRLRRDGEKWVGDNWGVSGYTSGDLVTLLDQSADDPARRAVLERADLIAISIGGNNILDFLREHGVSGFPPEGGLTGWLDLFRAYIDGTDVMAQEYLADLEVIIKEIRRVNPDAVILIQNIHNVARDIQGEIKIPGSDKNATDLTEPFYTPLLNVLNNNAERLGYYVADTYGAFRDSRITPLLRREMIHPNAAGHTIIADVLYHTYKTALQNKK